MEPGDSDRGTPFFLSYARAAEGTAESGAEFDADRLVERFFRDLSVNIAQLVSLRVGVEPGFMDRTMRGGIRWSDELLHALGTCQVLVALVSASYLSSDWCGMEWHAFSMRTVWRLGQSATPRQACIIPVIWAPVPSEAALPPQISAGMFFMPDSNPEAEVLSQYRKNGIFGLLRMQRQASYQIVVWQLAMQIAHVYHGQQVGFREFRTDELHNIFRGGDDD